MTARLLIKCDGPTCTRELDSSIHAGLWLTLYGNRGFRIDIENDSITLIPCFNNHFCSYSCLAAFAEGQI